MKSCAAKKVTVTSKFVHDAQESELLPPYVQMGGTDIEVQWE